MTIKEVFEKFEMLHSYSFSTIDGEYPEVRIAHFLTYDDDGLYFQTMKVKPFYAQLIKTQKLAVCALVADDGSADHDEDGLSYFPPGFFIRVSGDTRCVSLEELHEKALKDPEKFGPLEKDIERYPTMTTFVLHKFKGELYDYDFEKKNKDHKLDRSRFAFNKAKYQEPGFSIDKDLCVGCGKCKKVCTFNAIKPGKTYTIDGSRCDECGSCYSVCPKDAIKAKSPLSKSEKKAIRKSIKEYYKQHPVK
jgi:ferredoxin